MRSISILLVTLGLFASTAYSAPAGIAASVDIDVVNQVKNYAMPIVIDDINAYQVGKISFKQGYVQNI